MHTQSIHYSRSMTQAFFAGVSHADLKWTINYLMELLEIPETKSHEEKQAETEEFHSYRINKLLSIPKVGIKQSDLDSDERLQSILAR